jgi:signal transduction histidine kinase
MKISISELIDVNKLQSLMEKFTLATNTTNAIVDLDGEIITASGWQDICTKFHRENSESCKNCIQSDTALANDLSKGKRFNIYRCMNGLVDAATPIIVKGEHLANIFIGQFLLEEPDLKFFRDQAERYGFNKSEYLEALSNVPVLKEEEVKNKIEFLLELASMIGDMGISKLDLKDFAANLEVRIEERTLALKEAQRAALNMMQDAEEARTEAETMNKKLMSALDELKDSNEQLERFAYVASHDLQEPLRKIKSFSELLVMHIEKDLDEKGLKYINYVTSGAMRMQQLINDLLQFSRISTRGKTFEIMNMNSALERAMDSLSLIISERKVKINFNEMPRMKADVAQIATLMQNLLSNAIKYCDDDIPRIDIKFTDENNYWKFSVTDNGIGIDQQYQDRIFIIFQRLHAKGQYEGTGIGLAVCKKIVERHNGKIWFESTSGQGTTFYFRISKDL